MVKFSRRARADIRDIWNYTADRWGREQADIYLGLIEAAVDAIVNDPKLGRPSNDVRQGYRKHLAGSHVLFYRIRGGTILVGRILHQRMDPERHF
jgi:toxin ParE1/3/4